MKKSIITITWNKQNIEARLTDWLIDFRVLSMTENVRWKWYCTVISQVRLCSICEGLNIGVFHWQDESPTRPYNSSALSCRLWWKQMQDNGRTSEIKNTHGPTSAEKLTLKAFTVNRKKPRRRIYVAELCRLTKGMAWRQQRSSSY